MSQDTRSNAYDTLPYPPYSFPATHPGRLAAIGRLFALPSASPEKARVLELGCSSGINLLAMAQIFPDAEFVGVDYSKKQIDLADEALKATNLSNIRFINDDISKISSDLGEFDFILTHGIYSWVPSDVKDAILRISRENLKPHGIAYISYNCLPGWRMRGALRDMMLMHTAGIKDIQGKVVQSKALIKFLAESCSEETPYGKYLRQELELLSRVDDSYIAHDFLETDNDALYFTDFLKAAAQHKLGYLGDAEPATMIVDNMPGQAAQTLKSLNLNLLATEQYMDFVRNRMFRSTLLCRAENQLNRAINPECLKDFYATPLVSLKQTYSETQPAIFLAQGGMELTVADPFTADIFSLAIERRGKTSVTQLLEEVAFKHADKLKDKDAAAVQADLGRILINGYFKKMVDFTVGPASGYKTLESSEKPQTLPLARWQASQGHRVSSPRLDMLTADPFVSKFITLCDGTRDRDALIEAMVEAHNKKEYQLNENNQPVTDPERARFIIERLYDGSLQNLENLGLLPRKAA
jgi:methyltransferase-like protein/ubiquinone/menaquinone biosynthesis C-methylase UbiE